MLKKSAESGEDLRKGRFFGEIVDLKRLAEGVMRADQRAIARAISLCERQANIVELRAYLSDPPQPAQITGITGPPGAGKSTLIDALAVQLNREGKKVAIIAVDPTSPFSGGAILGDRLRMQRVCGNPGIFVRSIATRGALGGVSPAVHDAIWILSCAGFEELLVETVGVGQAEIDIVQLADTCLVLFVPGLGDSVQTFKAGVMEIGDVFVVNKSDRDGADAVERDLSYFLALRGKITAREWSPRIVRTNALAGDGISKLLDAIRAHRAWLGTSPAGLNRRMKMLEGAILRYAAELLGEELLKNKREEINRLAVKCLNNKAEISTSARLLLSSGPKNRS